MSTRIYLVQPGRPLAIDKIDEKPRLVRAGNAGQALRHVTKDLYTTVVADTECVARLVGGGTKVEDAKEGD